ncbi:MAG: SpoIIIAH-like family protein [Peptococcaceae bacterium]|jgi:stage III sporulation protein AH|nr:SpoIIIAH-like family protein [Peptococcaceae bacterium]
MKKLDMKGCLARKKLWGILAVICCVVLCFTFFGSHEEDDMVTPPSGSQGDVTPGQPNNAGNSNWQPSKEDIDSKGYYAAYRLEREKVRASQIELLNGIVNNASSTAEEKKNAQNKIMVITDNMGQELQIEQLLQAKGFNEAAVFIQDEKICIVLEDNMLSTDAAAQVVDIVKSITGKGMESVVIVPKNA